VRELAPAKINLSLLVGPLRPDGRHELRSVMQSITLCDELEMVDASEDEVECAGVAGPNLAADAIAAFRTATGWDGPGQRLRIVKRIPVAAGMGGGSADAAATLRLLARRSGLGDRALLLRLAAALGSDVAGQVRPGRVLARGGGEDVVALPDPPPSGVLVLPSDATLCTADVYREADRLASTRSAEELASLDPEEMIGVNDLAAAARTLEPSIDAALERALGAGAGTVMVCGSGPTVIALFDRPEQAAAAAALASDGLRALAARPFPRAGAW
jgi:4-diphosphocytidyl-2-C-methyl-D-erythritol kinase